MILALSGSLYVTCSKLEKSQKNEKRLEENARQQLYVDSLKFSTQSLKISEFKEYLKLRDNQLLDKINKAGVKTNKVERIITNNVHYINKDTIHYDLDSLKHAIINDLEAEKLITYSDSCLSINGVVKYDKNILSFDLIDKEFKNKTDVVVFTERKQWKFLFIKSKLFGKKYSTAKVFNNCGESYTTDVNVVN